MPAGLTAVSVSGPEPVIRQTIFSWSPTRAIGLPFTSTVAEPIITRPWLVGGFWNVDGGGAMCGGMFCAMLPCTAACRPLTYTLVDRLLVS